MENITACRLLPLFFQVMPFKLLVFTLQKYILSILYLFQFPIAYSKMPISDC